MAEIPGVWRKSRRSIAMGECAEVGGAAGVIAGRDTADRGGPVLTFGAGAWQAFTRTLRAAA